MNLEIAQMVDFICGELNPDKPEITNSEHQTTNKFQIRISKSDMAAKRRKKHKTKISGLVISMCYNEQKSNS